MKWQPDKNLDNKKEAEAKFKHISEAYDGGRREPPRSHSQRKGNEQPNVIPSDLVFIIDEKLHGTFTREGNKLIATVRPSYEEVVPWKETLRRGDLRIRFFIKFPLRSTVEQKAGGEETPGS
ncbi:hypothetical protein MLD38_027550 [Melastoma candidum]|uniref:Uncharacterized protein n=1 Tax=Melastoma candidum TaxID=119954 RepID=A0ACB9P7V8_9MYRT|nr:hypothetical protein MLD38_027550 [Melastoma candidum]